MNDIPIDVFIDLPPSPGASTSRQVVVALSQGPGISLFRVQQGMARQIRTDLRWNHSFLWQTVPFIPLPVKAYSERLATPRLTGGGAF